MNTLEQRKKKVRQDLNFYKYQIFTSSKNKDAERVIKTKNGMIKICRVGNYGLLQIFDYKVLLALAEIWEDRKRPTIPIVCSIYEIIHILKNIKGGTAYKSIEDSLTRLRLVPILWEHSYFSKEENKTYNKLEMYTILEKLTLKNREKEGVKKGIKYEETSFLFNELLLKNLLSNYSKAVYLDTILSLKTELSILLYRYIDFVLFNHPQHDISLKNLFSQLGLASYEYKSKRLEKIKNSIEELKNVELTSGKKLEIELKNTVDKKDYKCIFSVVPEIVEEEENDSENNEKKEDKRNKDILTREQAKKLAEIVNKKSVKHKITEKDIIRVAKIHKSNYEELNSLLSKLEFNGSYKPIQTIMATLKGTFIPEESFKDEASKLLIEEEKKRRNKRQQELEEEKKEQDRLDKVFNSLSKKEQDELSEQAVFLLKKENENNSSKYNLSKVHIKFKIRQMLKEKETQGV